MENIIGPFGSGTRNQRSDRLAEFAEAKKLYIMNSFFKKRIGKRWTWQSPDGNTKNEIDYIMTDCKRIIKMLKLLVINTLTSTLIIVLLEPFTYKWKNRSACQSNFKSKKKPKDLHPSLFQDKIKKTNWTIKGDIDEDYSNFLSKLKECKNEA